MTLLIPLGLLGLLSIAGLILIYIIKPELSAEIHIQHICLGAQLKTEKEKASCQQIEKFAADFMSDPFSRHVCACARAAGNSYARGDHGT